MHLALGMERGRRNRALTVASRGETPHCPRWPVPPLHASPHATSAATGYTVAFCRPPADLYVSLCGAQHADVGIVGEDLNVNAGITKPWVPAQL